MATHTYIYTDPSTVSSDGKVNISIHRLVGYMSCTIPGFQRIINDLHIIFPFIDKDTCEVGKIFRSDRFNGFSIVTWHGEVDPGILDHLPKDVHIRTIMDYWW